MRHHRRDQYDQHVQRLPGGRSHRRRSLARRHFGQWPLQRVRQFVNARDRLVEAEPVDLFADSFHRPVRSPGNRPGLAFACRFRRDPGKRRRGF
jgi:hypothetical protein